MPLFRDIRANGSRVLAWVTPIPYRQTSLAVVVGFVLASCAAARPSTNAHQEAPSAAGPSASGPSVAGPSASGPLVADSATAPDTAPPAPLSTASSDSPPLVGRLRGGRLEPSKIHSVVRPSYGALLACFKPLVARRPGLSGDVEVAFRIMMAGNVEDVTVAPGVLEDPDFSECVAATFKTLRFPAPDGGDVYVVYPLRFEPDPQAQTPKP